MFLLPENGQTDSLHSKSGPIYDFLPFATSVVVGLSSIVAVVGNVVVMAAIWRNASLRTPSYIILSGLAFTDFCTGLIGEPLYIGYKLTYIVVHKKYAVWFCVGPVVQSILGYFSCLTVFTSTFMAVERWLHMARSSLLTVRRVCVVFVLFMVIPLPHSVADLMQSSWQDCSLSLEDIVAECLGLLCLFLTSFAYFKVYRIIRRHQNQVQASNPSHNPGQPTIDLIKYKKSVVTIFLIVVLCYCCILPATIFHLLDKYLNQDFRYVASEMTVALFLISSSLNPFLYYWRIRDLRNTMKQLIRTKLLCKDS